MTKKSDKKQDRGLIFVVDGNWYLHRVFHTQNEGSKDPGAAMAYRFAAMVCKDALAVKAKRILVAFDGNNIFRFRLSKEYKANRREDKEDVDLLHNKEGMVSDEGVYQHLELVMSYTAELGIPVVQYSEYEADDVLCSVAARNPDVVIGGRDKDSCQFMRKKGLGFYDSSFKVKGKPAPRMIRYEDVEKMMGVPPELCLDLQTIIGDGVDNIPQLYPKAKSIKGLKKWGSLREWLQGDKEFAKLMRKSKAQLYLNRKLVALKSDIKVDIPNIEWRKSHPKLPLAYVHLKDFCNPKSRGLFS